MVIMLCNNESQVNADANVVDLENHDHDHGLDYQLIMQLQL